MSKMPRIFVFFGTVDIGTGRHGDYGRLFHFISILILLTWIFFGVRKCYRNRKIYGFLGKIWRT
jgi:hypothetical protein